MPPPGEDPVLEQAVAQLRDGRHNRELVDCARRHLLRDARRLLTGDLLALRRHAPNIIDLVPSIKLHIDGLNFLHSVNEMSLIFSRICIPKCGNLKARLARSPIIGQSKKNDFSNFDLFTLRIALPAANF